MRRRLHVHEATLRRGKPITLSFNCFELDGDAITVSHTAPADGTLGPITFNATAFRYEATYTPATGYSRTDRFTFKANNGVADSATAVRLRPHGHGQPRA